MEDSARFLESLFATSPDALCVEFLAFGPVSLRRWYRRVRDLGQIRGLRAGRDEVYYFGVLPRRYQWGRAGTVALGTCAWVDWAGNLPTEWPVLPTAIVQRAGRYQAYWRFTKPITDLDRLDRINAMLAGKIGGDPVANRARLLPLPAGPQAHKADQPTGSLLHLDGAASCDADRLEAALVRGKAS